MIGGGAISRRYARALFGLGEELGDPATMLGEVDALTEEILDSEELRRVLLTPLHARKDRRGVIEEVARALDASDTVRSFAMLLTDENRMALLPDIRDSLQELVDEAAGRIAAQVTSARELAREELEGIRQSLSRRLGGEVTMNATTDADLIGGVVVRVGDLLFDGSVRTQLETLGESLRKGTA